MRKAELKPLAEVNSPPSSIAEASLGTIAFVGEGEVLIDFEDNPEQEPMAARTTVDMTGAVVGDEVALVFVHR